MQRHEWWIFTELDLPSCLPYFDISAYVVRWFMCKWIPELWWAVCCLKYFRMSFPVTIAHVKNVKLGSSKITSGSIFILVLVPTCIVVYVYRISYINLPRTLKPSAVHIRSFNSIRMKIFVNLCEFMKFMVEELTPFIVYVWKYFKATFCIVVPVRLERMKKKHFYMSFTHPVPSSRSIDQSILHNLFKPSSEMIVFSNVKKNEHKLNWMHLFS